MSFKEIVGQDIPVSFLKSAYHNSRLAGAYLFLGPEREGKEKAALEFAKLLVCLHPVSEEPCGKCSCCIKTGNFNHPDVQWISPEGQFIKIDAIREACRRLNLKGFESDRKVLVISGAGHLNEEASNALLKTLEEPTPETLIILLADTVRSVLPTIASRCQKVVFSSLGEEKLVSILTGKFAIKREAAYYLARISEGSLGAALQYNRDGLFSRKNKIIADALSRQGWTEEFMQWEPDKEDRIYKIDEFLCVLSSWFRDLFLAKVCSGSEKFINIDRKEDILEAAGGFSFSEIESRLSAIAEAGLDARRNINTRIFLANLRSQLWK